MFGPLKQRHFIKKSKLYTHDRFYVHCSIDKLVKKKLKNQCRSKIQKYFVNRNEFKILIYLVILIQEV